MSKHFRTALLVGTAIAVLTGMNASTWAALIPIVNPGFEVDPAPDGFFNPAKTGWGTTAGGFGVRASGSTDPSAAQGGPVFAGNNNWLQTLASGNVNAMGVVGPLGGVSFVDGGQTVPTTIMANTRYTLSARVANDMRNPFAAIIPANDVYVGFAGGPTVLQRLVNVAGGSIGFGQTAGVTLVTSRPVPVPGGATTWTSVYETNAAPANLGGSLFIQLFVQSNFAGGTQEVLWDRVRLNINPVPEPGSLMLLGLGGLALAAVRRRAQR